MANTPSQPWTIMDEEYLDYLESKPTFAEFLKNRHTPCFHLDEGNDIGAEHFSKARRNVLLCAPDGSTVIAGIHQRGITTIKTFYRWLGMILSSDFDWHLMPQATEHGDAIQMKHILARDDERLIEPGKYIAVTSTGEDANLQPLNITYMPRMGSEPMTPVTDSDYNFAYNVLKRDSGNCLVEGPPYTYRFRGENGIGISGLQLVAWAHIFPVAYIEEWKESGLAATMEGYQSSDSPMKFLHSAQNGITLRRRLCNDFTSNRIAVDVDDGFRIVKFTGVPLNILDSSLHFESEGPQLRPPDELFRAHFQQALYRNVLGSRDLELADQERHYYVLAEERVCLEEPCWQEGVGKAALEVYLATRLFGYLNQPTTEPTMYPCRDSRRRIAPMELQSPNEIYWPSTFKSPPLHWPLFKWAGKTRKFTMLRPLRISPSPEESFWQPELEILSTPFVS